MLQAWTKGEGLQAEEVFPLLYNELRKQAHSFLRRERPGDSEVMNVIGDVVGKNCILVDDIVDSGGTLVNAADALLEKGAESVYAYITHGVLSGGAVARIASSKLKELVLTDSIQPTEAVKVAKNIRCISVAELIGEAIARTAEEKSVSSLFY